jgi:antitoxin (DNA-binding transcriptional repressor) of toxin-antitoxin stability system
MTTRQTPISQIIGRLKRMWAEIDYANRRRLEITTGWPLVPAADDQRLRHRRRPANAN